MRYRRFGKTGWQVSEISFGAWAIGGDWGKVSEKDANSALSSAVDMGINLMDTADVYGDGRSEQLVGRLIRERSERIYVATKAGRRLDPHVAERYTKENLSAFVERSLENLQLETLDLLQLHCPPMEVYYRPEVFEALDDLVKAGKIRHYGVSVEKVEEGLKALEYPALASIQIIFNIFRQRPARLFFREAAGHDVAIMARVPLGSGLLTGKVSREREFSEDDHRSFNREGQAFDVGETFSGVDFEEGLQAVEELRELVPEGISMAQFALRWILMFDEVTCAIPGGKNCAQVSENAQATEIPPLSPTVMQKIWEIYDRRIRPRVHHRW